MAMGGANVAFELMAMPGFMVLRVESLSCWACPNVTAMRHHAITKYLLMFMFLIFDSGLRERYVVANIQKVVDSDVSV